MQHLLASYVMVSRAKSLDGFLARRLAKRKELSAKPSEYTFDESQLLSQLEDAYIHELLQYIADLKIAVLAAIETQEAQRVHAHRANVEAKLNEERRGGGTITSIVPKRRPPKKRTVRVNIGYQTLSGHAYWQ